MTTNLASDGWHSLNLEHVIEWFCYNYGTVFFSLAYYLLQNIEYKDLKQSLALFHYLYDSIITFKNWLKFVQLIAIPRRTNFKLHS